MQRKQRTVVLVHGRHVEAKEWSRLIYGYGDAIGTLPMGLRVALDCDAEGIIFGTGASEKDGMKESEYSVHYFRSLLAHVTQFPEFAEYRGIDPYELTATFDTFLRERMVIDRETKNTDEEIKAALKEARLRGANQLIQVTSPAHAARCANQVAKLRESGYDFGGVLPMVVSARSSTATYSATDTVVFEHPHRGDDPSPNLSDVLPGIFKIQPQARYGFKEALAKLIASFQRS